jgi:hypothetical protein
VVDLDLEKEIADLREQAKRSQKDKAQEIFGDAFDFGQSSKSKTRPVEKKSRKSDRQK